MTIKKWVAILLLAASVFHVLASAQNSLGQVIQINSNFRSVIGSPTWLLIIRNEDTGQVFPYLFDVKNKDNFWLAFTYGRTYRITASKLTFGTYAVIHDFCHLEEIGILAGKSMIITLKGDLTPSPTTFNCNVIRFEDAGEIAK